MVNLLLSILSLPTKDYDQMMNVFGVVEGKVLCILGKYRPSNAKTEVRYTAL